MGYQLKLWVSRRERKLTGPNTLLAVSRTEGLSKSREELAGYRLPQPGQRQEAGGRGKGQIRSQRRHPYHTANRPPVSNQRLPEILEGRHLQGGSRLNTGRTRQARAETKAGTAEGRRRTVGRHLGRVCPSSSWLPELLRLGKAQYAGATESALLWNN